MAYARDEDWPEFIEQHERTFMESETISATDLADLRRLIHDDDLLLVRDASRSTPGRVVGSSMFFRLGLTVPGGRVVEAPGLTGVTVAATDRRRGILRGMMAELVSRWESEHFPVAMLNATEATIYERFGFGPATYADRIEIPTTKARLRAPAPVEPSTWFATGGEVDKHLPEIHRRWAATYPGAVHRTPEYWAPLLADTTLMRSSSAGPVHRLLHDDGYAAFRFERGDNGQRLLVSEVFALTPQAHTELWRVMLSTDLISGVQALVPLDDPLRAKLVDFRAVQGAGAVDMVWLRILDVPAALRMRTYRGDLDVVLEVHDQLRDSTDTFGLSVRDGVAEVSRSSSKPTVRLELSDLGSIYLGGLRARALADAGRLWTDSEATLDALDTAFSTTVAPFSGTMF